MKRFRFKVGDQVRISHDELVAPKFRGKLVTITNRNRNPDGGSFYVVDMGEWYEHPMFTTTVRGAAIGESLLTSVT